MATESTVKSAGKAIFFQRLKSVRMKRGLKGKEMAEFIGVSASTYSRYENARVPDMVAVSAIADRCGVTVDWLLGRTDDVRECVSSASGDDDGRGTVMAELGRMSTRLAAIEKQIDELRVAFVALLARKN